LSEIETAPGQLLWEPTPESIAQSNIARYIAWLERERGVKTGGYHDLWRWSVTELEGFWQSIWDYFGVQAQTQPAAVLPSREMPGAQWFEGARLNFAEHALRPSPSGPAIVYVREGAEPVESSWEQLRSQVAAVGAGLRRLGVRPGDRIAAYLQNRPEAVVGFLACASIGAVWTACAPDFGTRAVLDRFAQVQPRVLIGTDGYPWGGKRHDRRDALAELRAALPSVEHAVLVRNMFEDDAPPDGWIDWDELAAGPAEPEFRALPFDHPLWILFSSGTTGTPKGIVHGHGGILLEQLKIGSLCLDLCAGERFLFYGSTSWVVWNMHVCSLLGGVTLVIYDGSPVWPDPMGTLRVAAATGTNVLGTGAAYITGLRKAGMHPRELGLERLRHLIVTGSPLPLDDWRWVYEETGGELRLDSASGGTDVASAFVGGSPLLPVRAGEIACRWLGCAVEAWNQQGEPVIDEVGELVVTEPMPSMPLRFWNDPDGSRYHDSYFATFPGVWRHGDWIRINSRGGLEITGRSDSTLNRLGVRIGTAEIYSVVERLPEVADSIVLGVELGDGGYWMGLFVVPAPGVELDEPLHRRIREAILDGLTRRHLPDEILVAPAIPRTLTGKKLEVPLKRLMQGVPLQEAASVDAVDRPDAMRWFAEFARGRATA
jgi:acetoacetyl-CoA synthetase